METIIIAVRATHVRESHGNEKHVSSFLLAPLLSTRAPQFLMTAEWIARSVSYNIR